MNYSLVPFAGVTTPSFGALTQFWRPERPAILLFTK